MVNQNNSKEDIISQNYTKNNENIYKILTSKDFEKQVLIFNNKIVSEVNSPAVSFEENLFEDINKKPVPYFIGYDNTVVFPQEQDVPFPTVSLMHFFLADTLRNIDDIANKGPKNFVDLGCGSGFLGNYVGKNFKSVEKGSITFADLFPESIRAALGAYLFNSDNFKLEKILDSVKNIKKNNLGMHLIIMGDKETILDFRIGDASQTMFGEKADISMACPIYIPEICEVFPQAYALFGGISQRLGSDFYFAHSSLADKLVEESAKYIKANLTDIASKELPLVVDTFSQNALNQNTPKDKVEKLVSLGVKYKPNEKHKMWHELKVSKMSF